MARSGSREMAATAEQEAMLGSAGIRAMSPAYRFVYGMYKRHFAA
jgi:hypothetical protein